MRKDKAKVVDEVWDDERIESFLQVGVPADESADYHLLINAYRAMRSEDFERFVARFRATGRDVSAIGRNGETAAQTLAAHRHATAFINALS